MNFPYRVAPRRTAEEVEEIAWRARSHLGILPFECVPVIRLIEHALPRLMPEFSFEVVETGVIGTAEALTLENRPHIIFDERTYRDLERDDGRARMTAMHEVGHLLLHTNQTAYAFQAKPDSLMNPERQADIFASSFLMPECAFRQVSSIREAQSRFGVSKDAACCRARKLKMWDILNGSVPNLRKKVGASAKKKKGHGMNRTP